MARAIWKGSISFGLVNIPVQVHKAVRDHRPRFRMLHAADRSPVRLDRVCIRDGHPVAWKDLVKGFEYAKGRFAVLTKEDFEAAALEKTRTIDIVNFVEASEVDDRYFETPYYLVPSGRGAEHSYAVLREAIGSSGRIGIAKFILREAQHLAAVEAIGDALVLSVMRFADELVNADELAFPRGVKVGAAELKMARTLVDSLTARWDPSTYADDYKANLMRLIQAKKKGGRTVRFESATEKRPAEVVDLMERLRQSLAKKPGARRAAGGPRGRPARRRAS